MNYPTRDEIVAAHPLSAHLEKNGIVLVKSGAKLMCKCPFHEDKSPSMSVDNDIGVWFCHACQFGGSVIDFEIRKKGISVKQAMFDLATTANLIRPEEAAKPVKVATYEYRDQHNRMVFAVDRIEEGTKKRFAQWHPDADGKRVNNMDGVQRVLYRIEKWCGKEEINLVEGEKCVEAMERCGFDATCNAGGSGAWCDAYALSLQEKHVTVWPDGDEAGKKWIAAVMKSLEGKVASLRIVYVPVPYNDVADLIQAQGETVAIEMLPEIAEKVARITRGITLPLLSAMECYARYRKSVSVLDTVGIDLSKWLPSLHSCSRTLLPGDLFVFLSDTGAGKTSALLNIAQSQRPMPVVFFELELSPEPMCERFIAHTCNVNTLDVETATKHRELFKVDLWDHVFICPEGKMDLEKMEDIILRSELKIGAKPRLVLVDYVGLMAGGSGKRYERMSTIAEGLKTLARSTETVVGMASQIRRDPERKEIGLHDGKDSSSIESSAQLVMGAWRPDNTTMCIRVLKQTKRAGQVTIYCNFDGDKQKITERYIEGQP